MTLKEKLLAIQIELKAPKSKYNKFGNFYYRACEDIVEAVKPLCAKYKALLTLTETVELIGDRYYIKATALIEDVESKDAIFTTASVREADKKTGMDDAQLSGATSSYAKKRALSDLFAIDDTDDVDGADTQNGAGSAQRLTDERKAENRPTEQQAKKTAPRAPQNATEGKAIATADEMAQIKAKISAAKARTGLSQKDIFSKVIAAKFAYDKSASAFYSADFQKVCDFIDGLQGEEAEPLPWNE